MIIIMKNAFRRILHLISIIPQKLSRKKEDEEDQFYDAIEEPPDYIWNPPQHHSAKPPRPPLSDTDSLFEEDYQSDPYRQSILDRVPMSAQTSPMLESPWASYEEQLEVGSMVDYSGLMTSLVREEGHIYSLAASGDLLYTGSSSKNIHVWKHQNEYSCFKSHSGLVKAIVISGDKIFTGHQDGKIRVWRAKRKDPRVYKKIGTLPDLRSVFKKSLRPKNYTEVISRNHSAIWIKHFDVISSLSLNEDRTLLYSGSWDKTVKVWRVCDFKCLESISAHDDVINTVVAGAHDFVFSGSADGTLKVWQKELHGKRLKHFFSRNLLKQEFAVTSLAVTPAGTVVYAGSSDGVVHYWEEEKLIHGGVLRGHKLAVLCLTLSGNLVFSGSADRSICVWQRDEFGRHRCLYVLGGHKGPVKCLAVDNERQPEVKGGAGAGGVKACILYSGSLDKSVKIWRLCPQPSNKHQLPPPSPRRIDGRLRGKRALMQKNKLPQPRVCQQKK